MNDYELQKTDKMNFVLFYLFLLSKIFVVTADKINSEIEFLTNYIFVLLLFIYNCKAIKFNKYTLFLFAAASIFLLSNQLQQAASCFMLLYVSFSYSQLLLYNRRLILKKNIIIVLTFFTLIPFLISANKIFEQGVISDYGRNQILVGFNHPKEQASFVLFLYFTFFVHLSSSLRYNYLIKIIILFLLFFTDSRSILFGFIIYCIVEIVNLKNFHYIIMLGLSIAILVIFNYFDYDYLNTLSSFRMELWVNIFLYGHSSEGASIDSSWLEFARNNIYFLIPFALIFLHIYYYLYKLSMRCLRINQDRTMGALMMMYLFIFTFDLGAFSSTSLLAIIFWGNVLLRLKSKMVKSKGLILYNSNTTGRHMIVTN